MNELTFNLIENGPIKLTITPNEIEFKNILFDENNQTIPIKKNVFLCRCGKSTKQPYCNGTHKKVGFTSNKEIEEENLQVYEGKEINITFNRSICAGAANCVHDFSNIYSSQSSEDWISPDKGSIDEVINSIKSCPSGALSYTLNKEQKKESYEEQTIHIIKNGPLSVKGNIKLEAIEFSTNANVQKYTLCRCGASKNKPFCDYSHASLKDESYTF